MKAISELLPLAIGIAVIGAITWFLLDRNIGLGRWLLALLLLAHGWVHVMFVFPAPQAAPVTAAGLAYPFDMDRSWLIVSPGLDAGMVKTVGVVLMAAVFVAFALAAMATIGLLVPAGWWGGLVLVGAAGSTLLLALFFSPALLLGFAINVVLLWLVLASAWTPLAGRAI